jgi:hypothetical protein
MATSDSLGDGPDNSSMRGQIIVKDNGKLEPPKNIFVSLASAKTQYLSARMAHLPRIALYSQIEGLIAGNPPYDPTELQEHGLQHITNFNNLDARSMYEKACLAYWNLIYAAELIPDITLTIQDPESVNMSNIISEEFDKLLRSWPNFLTVYNTLTAQIVKFGISPVYWPDEKDWKFDIIELQRFFVQQQASTNTEKITVVFLEQILTAQYLYEIYNTYKDDENFAAPSGLPENEAPKQKKDICPWNVKALGELLIWYANKNLKPASQVRDMMDFQQRVDSGDFILDSLFSDNFRMVSALAREYDGKISHYMFDRFFDNGEFLFFVDRQYETLEEALVIFTASPGEFYIHSNRGVGHKIFAGSQAVMQIDCSIVDMTKFASTPFLKTMNTGGKEFDSIKVTPGVPTLIGQSEFVETNFGANIKELIGASQYMVQKMNYNAANSGDDPAAPDSDIGSLSDAQSRMKSIREFGIPKNIIQHFYSSFDVVIRNTFIKVLHSKKGYPNWKEAKEFKDRCIARGVPEVIFETKGTTDAELPPQFNAKATRVAGDGSTLATLVGLETIAPIVPNLTPRGVKNYTKMFVRAGMGPECVKALIDDEPAVGSEISLVAVENGIMRFQESPIVSPANDHQTHIAGHFGLINDTINQIKQQQMTPIDGDKIFSVAIPHTGQHIQIYSKSIFAEKFIKGIEPAWKEIVKFTTNNKVQAGKLIEAQIRERQKAAEQQQQVMSDAQRKDFVAQSDAKRDDYKVQQQVERAKEANETRAQIMKTKVEKDAENTAYKITLKHEAETGKYTDTPQYPDQNSELAGESTDQLRSTLDNLSGSRPAAFDFENKPNPNFNFNVLGPQTNPTIKND